jgi:hypothetical protein
MRICRLRHFTVKYWIKSTILILVPSKVRIQPLHFQYLGKWFRLLFVERRRIFLRNQIILKALSLDAWTYLVQSLTPVLWFQSLYWRCGKWGLSIILVCKHCGNQFGLSRLSISNLRLCMRMIVVIVIFLFLFTSHWTNNIRSSHSSMILVIFPIIFVLPHLWLRSQMRSWISITTWSPRYEYLTPILAFTHPYLFVYLLVESGRGHNGRGILVWSLMVMLLILKLLKMLVGMGCEWRWVLRFYHMLSFVYHHALL